MRLQSNETLEPVQEITFTKVQRNRYFNLIVMSWMEYTNNTPHSFYESGLGK